MIEQNYNGSEYVWRESDWPVQSFREEFDVLECPTDTHSDELMSMEMCNIFSVENYFPFLRVVKPGNAIEQTGFTCPVGSQ